MADADPELVSCIPEDERATVRRPTVTRAMHLPVGPWIGEKIPSAQGHLGYLVLEGLLSRELLIAGGRSVELLGAGDVIRPWQEDPASFSDSRFRALVPTRLAVLDDGFAERVAYWPGITVALLDRAVRRSRTGAAVAAIGHVVGIEQRLEALFWCLAERWGDVSREGVTIPLPLTHQTLADMIGAQRPSVTTALGKLARAGTLRRSGGTWRLRGDPPPLHQARRRVRQEPGTSTSAPAAASASHGPLA